LFYSSVAHCFSSGAAVSAATGAAFSTASGAASAVELLLFSCCWSCFSVASALCQNLYQKVLQQLQLLLKIKFYRLI
jgi:hypothetical protein